MKIPESEMQTVPAYCPLCGSMSVGSEVIDEVEMGRMIVVACSDCKLACQPQFSHAKACEAFNRIGNRIVDMTCPARHRRS